MSTKDENNADSLITPDQLNMNLPESPEDVIDKIDRWLKNIYGDQAYPRYEVTRDTVNILNNLMEENTKMCQQVNLIIDDLNARSEEYAAEGKRLAKILHDIGISVHTLPEISHSVLTALCSTAGLLKLRSPFLSNFLVGISDLSNNLAKVKLQKLTEQELYEKLLLNTKYMDLKLNHFRQELNKAKEIIMQQAEEIEKMEKETAFVEAKDKDYRKTIKSLMRNLKELEVDKDIHHDTLVSKSEEVKNLKEKLAIIEEKLATYRNLPPNLELAKLKVTESRVKLEKLNKLLEDLSK